MEVLAKLGIDWKLLIAQAVNFLVLLWILRRYAYGPILRVLEARTARIEQGLKDAQASELKLQSAADEEKKLLLPFHFPSPPVGGDQGGEKGDTGGQASLDKERGEPLPDLS